MHNWAHIHHISLSNKYSLSFSQTHTHPYRHTCSHLSFRHIFRLFLSLSLTHTPQTLTLTKPLYTIDIILGEVEGYFISCFRYLELNIRYLFMKVPGILGCSSPCSPSFPFCFLLLSILLHIPKFPFISRKKQFRDLFVFCFQGLIFYS